MKLISTLFFITQILVFGQFQTENELNLPKGLSLSNQLEYSYDTEKKNEILENWLNLDYNYGIFSSGFRFEIFQPNDPNPAIARGKDNYAEIAYKYLKAKIGNRREGLDITIGNFYGVIGRGLIFKSYEDRNVRIDNNLLGIYLEGNYSNFTLKALTGSAANINDERNDILHAIDLEFKGIKKIKLGLSLASNNSENRDDAATNLFGARFSSNFSFFDFHTEYALKTNNDIKESIVKNERNIIGRALYSNLNFYYEDFSVVTEYKYYDNFNFTSQDGTVQYNTSPSVIRDYSYILLNRHPHALNQNNEKGFQVEGNYVFSDHTNMTLSYGLTQTIGEGSFFNQVIGIDQKSRNQLKEMFGQIHHKWNNKLKSIFTFGYNEEASSNTQNITPIIENTYSFNETNSVRLILEHQFTKNDFNEEKYYSDVLTLEFFHSPDLSISFVGEMKTSEPVKDKIERKYWRFVNTSYKINDYIDISLLVGSRQAGNICIGGVCRYEPEFEGIELKMLTRLY
ncbi:MAG: hypothetical protein KDC88_06080 [Ignavibacteriae bacterium]|nr:hypothetical protein [Ignavibacteriota bacterium]MCB9210267.1 hypothetical protein [Ignavibacteriales bacterium]MCB9219062.1 hypothetical protein [Ignavibacteriales bacterium]MCB9259643.1 hypothetical protein [Ignavibacteriales bacterium]